MRRPSFSDRLVRGYFRLWSPTYDLSPLQLLLYRPVHHAALCAVARLRVAGGPMLDLGCGTARLTDDLARRHPGTCVVGLDVSEGMLRAAKRRLGAAVPPLVRADAYALPFRDGAFEVVASTIAYHWLRDPRTALAEIRRILRPGGHLVLGTLVARLLPGRFLGARLDTEHRHRAHLAAEGFSIEATDAVGWNVVVFTARARS